MMGRRKKAACRPCWPGLPRRDAFAWTKRRIPAQALGGRGRTDEGAGCLPVRTTGRGARFRSGRMHLFSLYAMRRLSKSFHAASCCSRSGRPERHVQHLLLRIPPTLPRAIEQQSDFKCNSYSSSYRHFHPCIARRTFFFPAFLLTACANAFPVFSAGMA